MIISQINLLSLIAVAVGIPTRVSRTEVNWPRGLYLKDPSACPSTPINLPVIESHASQYCAI